MTTAWLHISSGTTTSKSAIWRCISQWTWKSWERSPHMTSNQMALMSWSPRKTRRNISGLVKTLLCHIYCDGFFFIYILYILNHTLLQAAKVGGNKRRTSLSKSQCSFIRTCMAQFFNWQYVDLYSIMEYTLLSLFSEFAKPLFKFFFFFFAA